MNLRASGIRLVLGCALMSACKGASVPPPAKASTASVIDMTGAAHVASGPAYMAHSNKNGLDTVFVFEARTDPQPDCSVVAEILAGKMPDLDKGGWVGFSLKEKLKVGRNTVVDDGYISGDKAAQSISVGSGATDGIVLDVTKADGKIIEATMTSDGTAKNTATGTIFAVVCPN